MSERIEELLQAYLDGELDTAMRTDLEQRLSSDPALKGELDRLAFARDAVKGLPQAEAPSDLADQVLKRVQETTAPAGRVSSSRTPWPTRWRVAAAIALLALPGGGFAAGYRVGSATGPEATLVPEVDRAVTPTSLAAAVGPSDFLVLLHGSAGADELAEEALSWRNLQYANWADSLLGTGLLVRADDLSDDNGQGVWANGNEDPGEAWFPGSWAVPTRSYVVKAWDYDQALELARTSPHLAFGGSVTVRQITDGP